MAEDDRQERSRLRALSRLTSVLGVLAAIAAFASTFVWRSTTEQYWSVRTREIIAADLKNELVALQGEDAALKQSLAGLRNQLAELTKVPVPSEAKVATEVAEVTARVHDVNQRLARLEEGLSNSPEKALSVPLMRKDIDELKGKAAAELAGLKGDVKIEIDRVYDQQKWFMGAIAVGVLSLAVNNLLQGRKGEKT